MRHIIHTKKIRFYLRHLWKSLLPDSFWRNKKDLILCQEDPNAGTLIRRVDYYCKQENAFKLDGICKSRRTLSVFSEPSGPCLDLIQYLRYFEPHLKFCCHLNDYGGERTQPTFVKCRPIVEENNFFVLLKLNRTRFYSHKRDRLKFLDKRNSAIFRGPCHRPHRQEFIRLCHGLPQTDIGDTRESVNGQEFHRKFTPIPEQLKHKFIISIEGNDVASNLPWVMASNSLAFMTKPKFEGWFMQGKLVPNVHYVQLKDDYSDLEEKIDYYSSNDEEAMEIIRNAQSHVGQFFDEDNELLVSLLVLKKYFELSGQMKNS